MMLNKKLKAELIEKDLLLQRSRKDTLELKNQKVGLEKRLKESNMALNESRRKYQLLLSDLNAREKANEAMSRLALKEANDIINTAHQNADIIIRESLSTARQVLVEIARISSESHELKGRMASKLKQMQELIEGLDLPDAPNIKLLNEEHDTFSR